MAYKLPVPASLVTGLGAQAAPHCVARWLLDDAGTTMTDSVGAYDLPTGVGYVAATYGSKGSPWGACMHAGNSLPIGAPPQGATALEPAAITVLLWVKRVGALPAATAYLAHKRQDNATFTGSSPTNVAWLIYMTTTGYPAAVVQGAGGVLTVAAPTTGPYLLQQGDWTRVAFTYSAAAGGALYVNGQLAATGANVGAITYAAHGDVAIGQQRAGTGTGDRSSETLIRDVQVCDDVLTAAEAREDYQRALGTWSGA